MAATNGNAHRHHTLSVLVENKAGVLTRIAGLFARRAFNIYSLAVAPTDDERFNGCRRGDSYISVLSFPST